MLDSQPGGGFFHFYPTLASFIAAAQKGLTCGGYFTPQQAGLVQAGLAELQKVGQWPPYSYMDDSAKCNSLLTGGRVTEPGPSVQAVTQTVTQQQANAAAALNRSAAVLRSIEAVAPSCLAALKVKVSGVFPLATADAAVYQQALQATGILTGDQIKTIMLANLPAACQPPAGAVLPSSYVPASPSLSYTPGAAAPPPAGTGTVCPPGYQLASDGVTCSFIPLSPLTGPVAPPPGSGPGSGIVFQLTPTGAMVPGSATGFTTNQQGQTIDYTTGQVIPFPGSSQAGTPGAPGQLGGGGGGPVSAGTPVPAASGGSAGVSGILSGLSSFVSQHLVLLLVVGGVYFFFIRKKHR